MTSGNLNNEARIGLSSLNAGLCVPVAEKKFFIMRGMTPELINTYHCSACLENGAEHTVTNVPGQPTSRYSCWGAGLPTTMRKCSGCGFTDGPWVSADIVGGGW